MMTFIKSSMKTITAPACRYLVLALSALVVSAMVHAEANLTPERYVLLDQQVKQITVDGMAARLSALQQAPYDREGQAAMSNGVQGQIRDALTEQGITMTELLNYGAQHADSISTGRDEHTFSQVFYNASTPLGEGVGAQLQAIQE